MGSTQRPETRLHTFWRRVNKDGPIPAHCPELGQCWLWTGACNKRTGYGLIAFGPQGAVKQKHVHRYSWELHYGGIPNGLWVLHRCDNRKCIRPAHLRLGTPADNTADMMSKGRLRRIVKVGDEHIEIMRERYKSGESLETLANEFDISRGHVDAIVHYRER